MPRPMSASVQLYSHCRARLLPLQWWRSGPPPSGLMRVTFLGCLSPAVCLTLSFLEHLQARATAASQHPQTAHVRIRATMKSYVIDAYTDLNGLSSKYTDKAPEPKPGQNDVLCDVYSAALNFFGAREQPSCCFVTMHAAELYPSSSCCSP